MKHTSKRDALTRTNPAQRIATPGTCPEAGVSTGPRRHKPRRAACVRVRPDLFTHPKVVRMSRALNSDVLRVVGALISVWAVFNQHADSTRLDGYSRAALDEHIRWPGFANAMEAAGWLRVSDQGVESTAFDVHSYGGGRR